MLDFVVNLLIFFMITAVFVKQAGVESIARATRTTDETTTASQVDRRRHARRDLGGPEGDRSCAPCARHVERFKPPMPRSASSSWRTATRRQASS
jgi:hypothetical protein